MEHLYIQASAKSGRIIYDALPMESGNHADTHYFGKNFLPIMYNRKTCTVSPFLPEDPEQTGVPIVMGETAFGHKNGKTYLTMFGRGIWFGDLTRKSLIYPNQCWSFGVMICDYLTDKYRSLWIETDEFFVP